MGSQTMRTDEYDEAQDKLKLVQWTAEQANAWRSANPAVSPWRIVQMQISIGFALVLFAWFLVGKHSVLWSLAYGVICVVVPGAMFVHGVGQAVKSQNKSLGVKRFVVWELAKIALTIAMLWVAPRAVINLNWLALLAGFLVTMKVYWVAVWMCPVKKNRL